MSRLAKQTIYFGIGALILYLIFFIFFDRSVANFFNDKFDNTWLDDIGGVISQGAYSAYYKLIMALCFILVIIFYFRKPRPQWTVYLLYIIVSISIAIIIGDGFKYFLGRCRPILYFEQQEYGLTFFQTRWELNSSPSGHTIRAFALFTSLSMLFKRWRVLFVSLAILIGLSRIVVTAHYPSDVIFGAYIGLFTALWTYKIIRLDDVTI